MKAIVYTKFGGPEVLELRELEKPVPNDDEVLIKVHATSVNDWDWGIMNSRSFVERLMSRMSKPKNRVLGSDVAGTVEAVGKNIKKFRAGDHVYGDLSGQWGGFAEYVCAPERSLALKPPAMNFEEAAAIPQAGMLAVQGLIDIGNIQPGQKILINGAGGGVGTLGLQVIKSKGVEITVVDKPGKLDMLRSLGANHVIDYTKEDFTKNGQRYDLVLDTKTNRSVFKYLRSLTAKGKYVTVGGSLSKLFQAFLLVPMISLFSKKRVRIVVLKANKDLEFMNRLFETGQLKPVIDGTYRLEEVPEAFKLFEKGEHKGKIVISIS